MKRIVFSVLLSVVATLAAMAAGEPVEQVGRVGRPRYDKLSPMLRQMVRKNDGERMVCAFVRVENGGEEALRKEGCRLLEQVGDICIAMIPQRRLGELSRDGRIRRIEANRSKQVLNDSVARVLNVNPVHEGWELPQAFTGRGVVVGVMDIGFDLTHPTFYNRDLSDYRIRRFWDMLSADTVGSSLPVGRDYEGREELLAVAHARDGLDQNHGTHTTGTAAGSGYDSPYGGMAPESDICLVANAVTQDTVYIDPEDYDKYTFALDALGFKYIFDYAESRGLPCVINFSEGSTQDFWGYDQLYYEMLQRISGPGRIIVSAAGNAGQKKTWFRKPRGEESAGTFFYSYNRQGMVTLKSDSHFTLRLVAYEGAERDTLTISTAGVVAQEDSVLNTRVGTASDSVKVLVEAYPSCYNDSETCYDIMLEGKKHVGSLPKLSLEVIGDDADVELFYVSGDLVENALNKKLSAGEQSCSILSPASAPCVICVGATAYRQYVINYDGERKTADNGTDGVRSPISSVGPTYDGRTKPDVMAPGINVISAFNSYYLENNPDASDVKWNVANFDFNGRTYAWNSNSGTSMSSPVVAGIIALWLQACPTLTADDVRDVFSHTCRHYDPDMDYPNNYYGYGEIDAYRGLLYILGVNKIAEVSSTPTKASVTFAGDGQLVVQLPVPSVVPARISVYSLKGQLIARGQMTPGCDRQQMHLPALRSGDIYVVQIDGDSSCSGSMLVRAL